MTQPTTSLDWMPPLWTEAKTGVPRLDKHVPYLKAQLSLHNTSKWCGYALASLGGVTFAYWGYDTFFSLPIPPFRGPRWIANLRDNWSSLGSAPFFAALSSWNILRHNQRHVASEIIFLDSDITDLFREMNKTTPAPSGTECSTVKGNLQTAFKNLYPKESLPASLK